MRRCSRSAWVNDARPFKMLGRHGPGLALFEALSRTLQPPPDDPIAAAWIEEAERRWEEMESGEDPGIPGDEVFAEIREALPTMSAPSCPSRNPP